MEEFNWIEVALGVVAVALPIGFIYLRKIVKASETQVDDKILAAVEDALTKSKADESK